MRLVNFIEKRLDEQKMLNEATAVEVTKEAYTSLYSALDSLSDAFTWMAKKGTVDGGGEVPGSLRKTEVAIQKAKDKIKASMKEANGEKFEPATKKVLGEIGNSLEKLAERVKLLVDSLDSAVEEIPVEEPELPFAGEEEPVEDEILPEVKPKGRKK